MPPTVMLLAVSVYVLNVLVGVAAWRTRRGFGPIHHALYALGFVGTAASAWLHFHPALLVTLICLAVLPLRSARSRWHPTVATLGLLGWVVALWP
jgi:hypothetical protein